MDDMERAFFEETGLLNMEEAMKDPVLAEVTKDAKARALEINIEHKWNVPDDYEDNSGNVEEFDQKIKHLYDTVARVSGVVHPMHPEVDYLSVDDAPINFLGFIPHINNGTLEYRYFFQLYVDSDIQEGVVPLSVDQVTERISDATKGGVGLMAASASIDSLHTDFETMHPQRSMAWLEERVPGLIDEIDRRIISEHGDFSERSILNLRGMSVLPPEGISDMDRNRYFSAISEYLNYMLSIDKHVPYLVKVSYPEDIADLQVEEKFKWVQKTNLYVMNVEDIRVAIAVIEAGDIKIEKDPALIIRGVISDPNDSDAPAVDTFFNLDDIENIVSMRKTQKKLIASIGKAGLAK